MNTDSFLATIHRELQHRFRTAGPGSIGRVENALDLSPGYFRDQRRPDRLRVDLRVLLKTLDLIEVDPAEFFATILGRCDPLISFCSEGRLLATRHRRAAPILDALEQRFHLSKPPTDIVDLQALDAQRDHDPKRLLRQAKSAMRRIGDEQVIPLLGIYASACRSLGYLRRAHIVLATALEMAHDGPSPIVGDLLLRSASVLGDQGRFEQARDLAERAITCFALADDRLGIAKALIKRGIAQGCQGRQEEEIRSFTSALRYLSDLDAELDDGSRSCDRAAALGEEDIRRNLFSALTNLALAYHQTEDFDQADYLVGRALKAAEHMGPALRGKLTWLRGSIAWRAGRLQEAEEHLQHALELHHPRAPLSCALIAVDLVQVQLQGGQANAATQTARAMTRLVQSLEPHPVASAAVTELIRCALEGKELTAVAEEAAHRLRQWGDLNPALTQGWNRRAASFNPSVVRG